MAASARAGVWETCSCTGMSSKPITRVSTKESTTESAITANTQAMLMGLAGSKNCTLVKSPGAAMEWLASPAMPATAPQMKPLMRLAMRGRFNRRATP